MLKKMPDRDHIADFRIIRQVRRQRTIKTDLPLFDEQQNRGRCELFRDRPDPVHRVRSGWHIKLNTGETKTFSHQNFIGSGHADTEPHNPASLNRLAADRLNENADIISLIPKSDGDFQATNDE